MYLLYFEICVNIYILKCCPNITKKMYLIKFYILLQLKFKNKHFLRILKLWGKINFRNKLILENFGHCQVVPSNLESLMLTNGKKKIF